MGLALSAIASLPTPGVKLLSTFGHDWGADDLSQGSWATYRPGTVARFNDELPRQEGHVFFASGDHAQGWRGFIEGAIASGSRTAVTVADSLSSWAAGASKESVKQPAQA